MPAFAGMTTDELLRCRDAFAASVCISPEGGGAPKSANPMAPHPLPDTAGASRRATCGDLADGRAALSLGTPLETRGDGSPSFRSQSRRAQIGQRPIAQQIKSSASSWRGLIVDPGGAPAPPECRALRSLTRGTPHLVPPHDAS
jgi:hypothetical protein